MRRYTLSHPRLGNRQLHCRSSVPARRVASEGDTVEEAIADAREAIAAWINSVELDGEEIPEEKVPLRLINIDVP